MLSGPKKLCNLAILKADRDEDGSSELLGVKTLIKLAAGIVLGIYKSLHKNSRLENGSRIWVC